MVFFIYEGRLTTWGQRYSSIRRLRFSVSAPLPDFAMSNIVPHFYYVSYDLIFCLCKTTFSTNKIIFYNTNICLLFKHLKSHFNGGNYFSIKPKGMWPYTADKISQFLMLVGEGDTVLGNEIQVF